MEIKFEFIEPFKGKYYTLGGECKSLSNISENDKLHREDGPAIEYPDGNKEWYMYDYEHRKNKPSVELAYEKRWNFHGNHHYLDGPAIEYTDGLNEYFIHGIEIK